MNDPTQKPVKTHSKFEPSYSAFVGHQFGLCMPHFAMAGVADDDISMRVAADADTFTLKAPMMVPIKRNMDYFQLPLRALLPKGAELLITNPLRGDDVVAEKVNAVVTQSGVAAWMNTVIGDLYSNNATTAADALGAVLRAYQTYQMAFSRGSLPMHLGMSVFSEHSVRVAYPVGTMTQTADLDVEKLFSYVFNDVDAFLAANAGYIYVEFEDYSLTVQQYSGVVVSTSTVRVNIGKDLVETHVPFRSGNYNYAAQRKRTYPNAWEGNHD